MNKDFKVIELTHQLSSDIPTWDGNCGFRLSVDTDYNDCTAPDLFRVQGLTCNAGIGTHMDAPAHVIVGGRTIDQINLEELVVDCIMIDVSAEADATYKIMPSVIETFEKEHGEIKPSSFVIFYTGWDKHWGSREKYNNDHVFPSVDISTAEILLKRSIAGLGIDTLSADTGAEGFPVHRAILGADKYLVENIANAKNLPPTGAKVFILPIKMKDATEAPVRLFATI